MNTPINKRLKILLLDAQNQNTLAIVRHLGPMHEVHVAGASKYCLSFFSRHVSGKIRTPDPKMQPVQYINKLIEELKSGSYDLLMPVGYISYKLCAERQDELKRYTKLIVTSSSNISIASDKKATYELAEQLGVPYPKSYAVNTISDFDNFDFQFPLVIKYPYEVGKNIVSYVHNIDEAKNEFIKMMNTSSGNPVTPIVQDYIVGDGYGFFAFYEEGVCKRYFMHHRIREYPVTGGASVCAESYNDEELRKSGTKILDHLKWNGVAMVEYKRDNNDGKYKLMEINPKFWGSLELAICSGQNFPAMLCDRSAGIGISDDNKYSKVTFQWLINGELFHFFNRPSSFFRILRTMNVSKTDFRWNDIKPNLFQVLNIFVHFYKKIIGK